MKSFFKGNRSSNFVEVKLDTDKLDSLLNTFMAGYFTRVGILGSKTNRTKTLITKQGKRKAGKEPTSMTNAEIGLTHEKGSLSRRIPRRSFLEMPIVLKSEGLLAASQRIKPMLTGKDTVSEMKSKWKKAYVMLGIIAERIIHAAFESRGFGKWAPDSPITIARKHSDMPLIDTRQLERSITSDVITK